MESLIYRTDTLSFVAFSFCYMYPQLYMGVEKKIKKVKLGPAEVEFQDADKVVAAQGDARPFCVNFSPDAIQDIQQLEYGYEEYAEELLHVLSRHRRLIEPDVKSIPFPVFFSTAFISTHGTSSGRATVDRVVRNENDSPLWNAWLRTISHYRKVSSLPYRTYSNPRLLSETSLSYALKQCSALLKVSATYSYAYKEKYGTGYSPLDETITNHLIDDAYSFFDDGDVGNVIASMESLLAHIHSMLVKCVPVDPPDALVEFKSSPLVLVVDDEPSMLLAIRAILESIGCEVVTVPDGTDALEQLHARAFDLMITDVIMPKCDGIELTMDAAKNKLVHRIIGVSGGGRVAAVHYGNLLLRLSTPLTSFFEKPFSPANLRDAVIKLLRQSV